MFRFKKSLEVTGRYLRDRDTIAVYLPLGVLHFLVSVGYRKLDPKNIAWLVHNDQVTHWIGWRFFAESGWQWPPGANSSYGWESTTSIIATDSWPLLALIFKLVQIPEVVAGQYFGIGYLLGSLLLSLGSARLLVGFGLEGIRKFVSVILIITIPMFWFMHRWYPALSGGMALLVWAICFYFEDMRKAKVSTLRWTALLAIGVSTQFYLFAILLIIYGVTVLKNWHGKSWKRTLLTNGLAVATTLMGVMYLLGYFMIPLTRASTGSGYGEFSANLLSPLDPEVSSSWRLNLPSTDQQYEPTFVGYGAIVLVLALAVSNLTELRSSLRRIARDHWLLLLTLALLSLFAISNIVTVGDWSFRVPIPLVVEQALSVFRSSVRFIWPMILMAVVAVVVLTERFSTRATIVLVLAAIVQIVDVSGPIRAVAERPDGETSIVQFDESLWNDVPVEYTTIAQHPAGNYKEGWAECAYSALVTNRSAQCAYLARVIRLTDLNERRDSLLAIGEPSPDTILWLDFGWVKTHANLLQTTFDDDRFGFVATPNGALMFPDCDRFEGCRFLEGRRQTVDEILAIAGS